jgi:hypothetical protein
MRARSGIFVLAIFMLVGMVRRKVVVLIGLLADMSLARGGGQER